MSKELSAFVIMPFDPEFLPIYEDLIKPALEDAGFNVARADSFLDQQNILRNIVRGIGSADLIVADLTTLNPNVLYELGLCHGLRIPTILLAQAMDEVPFDLRTYMIQIYSTRFDQVHKLKNVLKEIGEKHKAGKITFGSPISDFLTDISQLIEQAGKIVGDNSEKKIEEVEEEKGIVDFIFEVNEASSDITNIFEEISNETMDTTEKMKKYTNDINYLNLNKVPGSAIKIHKIASMTAIDMMDYSEKMEKIAPRFDKSTDVLIESSSKYITWISPTSEEQKEGLNVLRNAISSVLVVSTESLEATRQYSESIGRLRGISKDINRASRRLTQALEGIISPIEKLEAFCVKTLPLIDEKL